MFIPYHDIPKTIARQLSLVYLTAKHTNATLFYYYNSFDASFGIWLNTFFQSPSNNDLCGLIILCRHRPVLEYFFRSITASFVSKNDRYLLSNRGQRS